MDRSRSLWALALALGLTGCAGADRRVASVPTALRAPAPPPRAPGGLFARRAVPARPVMTSVSPTVARFFPGLAPAARDASEPGSPLAAGAVSRSAASRLALRSAPAPALARAPSLATGAPASAASSWLTLRPAFMQGLGRRGTSTSPPAAVPEGGGVVEPLLPVALHVAVSPAPLDGPDTRLASHEALLPAEPFAPGRESAASVTADAPPPIVETQPTAMAAPSPSPSPAAATRPAPPRPVSPAVAIGSDAPPIPGGFGAMQLFPNSYYERAPEPTSVSLPPPARRAWRPWSEWPGLAGGGRGQVAQGG